MEQLITRRSSSRCRARYESRLTQRGAGRQADDAQGTCAPREVYGGHVAGGGRQLAVVESHCPHLQCGQSLSGALPQRAGAVSPVCWRRPRWSGSSILLEGTAAASIASGRPALRRDGKQQSAGAGMPALLPFGRGALVRAELVGLSSPARAGSRRWRMPVSSIPMSPCSMPASWG